MPLSPSEASVINSSMQVSSQMGTNYSNRRLTEQQNKIDRDREDYWNYKQREWAEQDWQRAAQYNSPMQQMKRFKEAGLNPNLIYGKASEMPVMKSPSTSSTKGSTPRVENPLQNVNVAQAYYSAQMMEKQLKLLDQEIVGKRIDNASAAIDSRVKAQDYMSGNKMIYDDLMGKSARDAAKLAEYQSAVSESQIDKLNIEMAQTLRDIKTKQEFEKLTQMQLSNAKSEKEKEYLESKLVLLKDEHKMNEYELQLQEMGINKSDPVYFRIFNALLNAALGK